jgi:hypothetical protein
MVKLFFAVEPFFDASFLAFWTDVVKVSCLYRYASDFRAFVP